MERSDWDDPEEEPSSSSAPLPPEQRAWRHPSELGDASARLEPPPVPAHVGRGLAIVAGALGVVLAVGLVRLLLPPGGTGSTADVSASSAEAPATFLRSDSTAATLATAAPTTMPPAVTAAVRATADARAVAIGVGDLLLTTAAAVGDQPELLVEMPDGTEVTAQVRYVDPGQGIAVLDAGTGIEPVDPAEDLPAGGDEVVVLTDEPFAARVQADDGGRLWLRGDEGDEPVEGAPVIDADGHLVGLCSGGADAVRLVPVDVAVEVAASVTRPWLGISGAPATPPADPAPTTTAPTTTDGSTAATAGTRPPATISDPTTTVPSRIDGVVVADVLGDSPAARAGIGRGEVIVAVDGEPVATIDDLVEVVGGHRAGDSITLTVRATTGATRQVSVVLTTWPVAT